MEQNINQELIDAKFGGTLKKHPARVFKGKTEFVLDYSTPETLEASKKERHFHQRMLRAYLKGKEYFNFGRNEHKVLSSYK